MYTRVNEVPLHEFNLKGTNLSFIVYAVVSLATEIRY